MKSGSFCILLLLYSATSLAGGGTAIGNGGLGVREDKEIYLYDLVLAKEEKSPFLGDAPASPEWLAAVSESSVPDLGVSRELLAAKLESIDRSEPGLGAALLLVFKKYQWKLAYVSPWDPNADYDGNDEWYDSFLNRLNVILVANRLGETINISPDKLEQMPASNQLALLIHEAVYSLVRPRIVVEQWLGDCTVQPAEIARDWTAFIFNSKSTETNAIANKLKSRPTDLQLPPIDSLKNLNLSNLGQYSAEFVPYEDECFKNRQYSVVIK